jgi:ribosome-binding protein aMBF1 (putative translation factor)
MSIPNLDSYPLCRYFLSGYLSMRDDPTNFPPGEFPHLLDRYEKIFQSALQTLGLKPEELRSRSEFKFDSGDAANLEGGIAILRVVEALRLENFLDIALVRTNKGMCRAALKSRTNSVRCKFRVLKDRKTISSCT